MPASFAIIHTWPDLRNAEYEVVQRLIAAAANLNRPVVVIDNNGVVVWATPELHLRIGQILSSDAVEFVISLHFESPRTLDIYSYYAVWQPIDFYYDFGYRQSVDKLSTHNDLISCASDLADAHALNVYSGMRRAPLMPLPQLFHMVAEPYLEPNISSNSKLFYIGINWERVGRPKGRFHDVLVSLDAKGLTSIYGPERILGAMPWEGFKTYQGELPFDGHSVKRAINRAGICLALSSAQHKRTGIMSNRLFEGLAGGAAVIATPNPLIDKYFRDVVYLVDDSRGEEVLGQLTLEAVREIRSETAEARKRVIEGQRILREMCSLEGSIERMFDVHHDRKSYFENNFLAGAEVTVILMDDYASVDRIRLRLAEYRSQKKVEIDLHLVCERAVALELADEAIGGAVRSLNIHGCDFDPVANVFDGIRPVAQRTGPVVSDILRAMATPLFLIAGTNEVVFSDHVASLAKALEDDPDAAMACAGALRETFDGPRSRARSVIELRFEDFDSIAQIGGPSYRSRYLFRAVLVDADIHHLLTLLDGEEHRYFQLAGLLRGKIVQTQYATYILDEAVAGPPRKPAEPSDFQHQAIRDRFSQNYRWLERLASIRKTEDSPPPAKTFIHSGEVAARGPITIGRMLETSDRGEGAAYLGAGFAQPEAHHTWLASGRGIIDFTLPSAAISEELEVTVAAFGRRSMVTGREQHCTFVINGMSCAYLPMPEELTELRVRMPRDLLSASHSFRLELIPDHVEPVAQESGLNDSRELAIALLAFGVMPQASVSLPILRPNRMHGAGEGEDASKALLRGFYEPEPSLVWMAGTSATIRFRLSRMAIRPVLRLGLWGRRSAEGDAQIAYVTLNKQRLAALSLSDRQEVIDIPLAGAAPIGTQYNLEVRLKHAEVAIDGNGKVLDNRLLGLAVTAIGVFEDELADPDVGHPSKIGERHGSDDDDTLWVE